MKKNRKLFKELIRRNKNQAEIVANAKNNETRIMREFGKKIEELENRGKWPFMRRLKYLVTCK